MLEVHARLRKVRAKEAGDPIPPVAEAIAGDARLLAFDEMVINNSADAMILSRLFGQLIDAGVTVITTSNRPPWDLYKDGINRELFLPFIELIKTRMDVIELNGPTDYRRERLGNFPLWYVPNGPEATEAMRAAFFRMTDFPPEDREHVPSADIGSASAE
jgi:cell division protein ZapE